MSQAIVTKYHGPTDTKGARISARMVDQAHASITIGYPHELSGTEVYRAAALELMRVNGIAGSAVGGKIPGGEYAFVVVF